MIPYEEVILEHWRNPRNKGRLPAPDVDVVEANPLCGDVIRLQLKVREGRVQEVRFDGRGCAISQAAASLLTEMIKGKTIPDLKGFSDQELLTALGGVVKTRLSCALLPLRALKKALSSL